MIRVAISVEGDTEADFVRDVLFEPLLMQGVAVQAILPGGQGGNVSVDRVSHWMVDLLRDFDYVTSLFDFYGFKRKGDATVNELECRINQAAGKRIHQEWDGTKLFAYVQKHEFEALLFACVGGFRTLDEVSDQVVEDLREIRNQFTTPEEIDDSPINAPSKRIERLIRSYNKRVDGPDIAMSIGLQVIRAECPRFDSWVTRIESLGTPLDEVDPIG